MADAMPPGAGLTVHSEQPFNAEPPLARLRTRFVTDARDFYIRSHGAVPELDEASHRLRVAGRVARPLDLSMAELRGGFAQRSVMAVLQCAGNRRADLHSVRPVSGDPWQPGAIGNAEWTGVPLAAVLKAAGAGHGASLHVAFEACDEFDADGEHWHFGVSIPMEKARSPEVLRAFAMNGEPLTPAHGYPLRAIVPGYAGVRSPKWLASITVQNEPSDNPMQRRDYKLLPPHVSKETVDWKAGLTINEMPLNSAICEPAQHARLSAGPVMLRGYAIAAPRQVMRVDVSADAGRSWSQAQIEDHFCSGWSWVFWRARVELPPGVHDLAVRAWDSAGQTQPSLPQELWNFKGYLCAAWHRVRVTAA